MLIISYLIFTSQMTKMWKSGFKAPLNIKSCTHQNFQLSQTSTTWKQSTFNLLLYLRRNPSITNQIKCEEAKTATWNSPAPSAHTAPCQTYAAPWHVQRGQTEAEAWVAKPTLWRAYPGPVAILVWTRLREDEEEMQGEKTGERRCHIFK